VELEEIRRRLRAALPIRCPLFNPNESGRQKVEQLEDYLAKTAWHRAELEEALYWSWEVEKVLRAKWEGIEGWEQLLGPGARQRPTQAQITAAKARVDQSTYEALAEVKEIIEGLKRQIERLRLDDANTSRRYSLLSGS
jgi:uncharacterized protein (DUF2132 family)